MRLLYASFGIYMILLLNFSCGLFYRGVPKKGEFCYVMAKPPECLFVDFEKRKLHFENKEFDLEMKTRTEYSFSYNGTFANLLVSTENRVDLQIPGETIHKFYMRKKEKYSHFPESKS